jgi:GT2 family glycosyltransferase
MCGWAFAVKVAARTEGGLPPIDENTRWWGGDDDLSFTINQMGFKVGYVEGVPIHHLHSRTFAGSGLQQIANEDLNYIMRKWNR